MKRLTVVFFLIILALNSFSQAKLFQIERNISEFHLDTLYTQVDFSYSNTSNSLLVLWIEKNNVDSLSVSQKINKHFFTMKGDWSLMQILWDGNVASFVPGLFDSFFKVIKPGEKFVVSVLHKGKIKNDSEIFDSINNRIIIVNAKDIKGLQIDGSIDLFNYKAMNLIILAEWLNLKEK